MSECPYCQNTFEMNETCADEFTMWQGLVGPYYYPYIDINGYLTWSNTGDLPNPDPVNIIGPPGHGVDIKGIVATYSDLPPSPDNGDVYLVGNEAPYDAYVYFEGVWTDIGDVSKGEDGRGIVSITKTATSGLVDTYTITYTDESTPTTFTVTNGADGVGVPASGTTGQVLAKASDADYDTEWIDVEAGGGTVQSVNEVLPDQNGNITLTADDIGTDATNISIQDALDDYVYVGTSAPTDPTTKIWLDTDEPGMSAVSSVNGKTGTVVLDLDDIGFMTLLWTNASPTSNFAAQTVSLDLSGYDAVFVVSNLMTTGENNTGVFVKKGLATETNIVMYGAIVAASAMTVQIRGVTATDTGVVFSDAKLKAATSTSAGSTENSRCIPLYIFGIKGVA